MTVNGVMAPILRYITEFGIFLVHFVKGVEDTLILTASEMYPK